MDIATDVKIKNKDIKILLEGKKKCSKGSGSTLGNERQEPRADDQEKQIAKLTIFIEWVSMNIAD